MSLSVAIFSSIIFCISVQLWLMLNAIPGFRTPLEASYPVWPQWPYLMLVFCAQAIGIWTIKDHLTNRSFFKKLLPFFVVELLWTVLLINAAFKILVFHQQSGLAYRAFIVLSMGALISKIFWPELKQRILEFWAKVGGWQLDLRFDLFACLGLVALLYVPDTQVVLARMFLGDQFHHFDSFVAPAWGFAKGAVLNMDVMTEYGIGIPVAMAWFAKLTGGFSYSDMFWFWMMGTIVYFLLCFIFLRLWLKSFTLSLITVLLAIKFQMFHSGIIPFVFTLPSATVVRYFWDIVFFILLYMHLYTFERRYFFLACISCGIQIFWMTTCGYCQTLALVAYALSCFIMPEIRSKFFDRKRDLWWMGLGFAAIGVTTLILFVITQGPALWTHEFWANMQEFDNYFLSGFGLMPMYETIQHKEVLAGFMGFFIPMVYMATFLVISGLLFYRQAHQEDLLAAVLAIYGMAIYHYYIGRSAPTSYYVVCVPYVFILGFWVNKWLDIYPLRIQRPILAGLFLLVVYCLFTNHTYLAYPNVLNISRNPIIDPLLVEPLDDGRSYFNQNVTKITEDQKIDVNNLGQKDEGLKFEKDFKSDAELVSYYQKESDFSSDAALIDSLTAPTEPVALLSSFEIKMLMQADRRQFFYYSPILLARPLKARNFPNSTMYTTGHLMRTLKQLQEQKPTYVFMEKIYLRAPGFKSFQDRFLAVVLNDVYANYVPYAQGQYLVAMKRRG